jgi:hypothetical protein
MKATITILILSGLLALANHCNGQDMARPVHGETGRQWAARGNTAPDSHTYETSLDEVLLTDKPYQLPAKNNPRYNDALEAMVNTKYDPEEDNYVTARAYKQGIFIGYVIIQLVPVTADQMQKI